MENRKNPYVIELKTPVVFEGEEYKEVDLTGLENIRALDMIEVNRKLAREGNVDFLQENSMEYAFNIANRASGIPIQFFEQLKPGVAMQVKRCVTSFLFSQE